jgi:Cdc6-like AAA superfamily ATPase
MPDGEGLEVIAAVGESDPTISVVMLTGVATIELAVASMRQGAFDFLTKPFQPDVIRATARRACEHTRLRRENVLLKDAVVRLEGASDVYGESAGIQAVREKIARVAPTNSTVLITGETGTGKTTAAKLYEKKFPRRETREGTKVPVLSAAIPVPATVKSLATKLLVKLGDPAAERGTAVNQTLRIQRLVKSCGVELIVLDEFQHFIERESQKILTTVSDWLKEQINETRLPMVLIGLPSSKEVLDANAQLKRRFSTVMSLDPFGWETPEQKQDFRKFLRAVEERLPLPHRSNLHDVDTAFRFICATGGMIASVMQLTRRATAMAIERSMEALDLDLLAEAYDERLAVGDPKRKNPFHV